MIEGYERVASSPAWKSMRNMNVHPRDAVLPSGMIMTGNAFERNIEKIGPYRDELRASWPIVEAEGAREHPVRPPH